MSWRNEQKIRVLPQTTTAWIAPTQLIEDSHVKNSYYRHLYQSKSNEFAETQPHNINTQQNNISSNNNEAANSLRALYNTPTLDELRQYWNETHPSTSANRPQTAPLRRTYPNDGDIKKVENSRLLRWGTSSNQERVAESAILDQWEKKHTTSAVVFISPDAPKTTELIAVKENNAFALSPAHGLRHWDAACRETDGIIAPIRPEGTLSAPELVYEQCQHLANLNIHIETPSEYLQSPSILRESPKRERSVDRRPPYSLHHRPVAEESPFLIKMQPLPAEKKALLERSRSPAHIIYMSNNDKGDDYNLSSLSNKAVCDRSYSAGSATNSGEYKSRPAATNYDEYKSRAAANIKHATQYSSSLEFLKTLATTTTATNTNNIATNAASLSPAKTNGYTAKITTSIPTSSYITINNSATTTEKIMKAHNSSLTKESTTSHDATLEEKRDKKESRTAEQQQHHQQCDNEVNTTTAATNKALVRSSSVQFSTLSEEEENELRTLRLLRQLNDVLNKYREPSTKYFKLNALKNDIFTVLANAS